MQYDVIVLAAGQGKRMKAGRNKQFLLIRNVPLLVHTLNIFETDHTCNSIILVINDQELEDITSLLEQYPMRKVTAVVSGGQERQHSVYNGLKAIKLSNVVLIHDGARPFVKRHHIHKLVEEAAVKEAATLGVPVKETIKKVENNIVVETIERSSLWSIQTPQAFLSSTIQRAHNVAKENGYLGTDDASLVEQLGQEVAIVQGDYDNIKLTTPEDLIYAEAILTKLEQNN
ncbi:2-C-methyl-D-erythritol 4-phosphate cytidylyltransferase [Priestia flexa]|uniref:2-C-methyl-D-erythritol 4-phosphate cytidylyltransferase n=1 Tax=Priestia flexa TaxID=86664 RepID=UPI00095448C2|nr:2-C-methyl-D-erythritol 4-phosphate cytidylyltransferase [Priestia flexa]MEC0664593.1 2-C-methyl-D-erythritol 4-phosphate cytidylyltransferase [Priestia flexa]MED3822250.1 2-C-methyl-D-erythritol 4-phosphate cytidylyltransferase [Priestia flexa]SIR36086.1 2-C-methyl-D-erythritol 4-phosphate cytidylyltransferase [Priestia flexa]